MEALPEPLYEALEDYRSARAEGRSVFSAFVGEMVFPFLSNRWTPHLVLAFVLFATVVVFFYAPRSQGISEPGLWKAFTNPGMFPAVLEEATLGSWESFVGKWGGGNESSYLSTFKSLGAVLWAGAAALLVLSVVGFVVDRYAGDRPRDVVSFTFYWGAVSVLGYPVIVENAFPWEVVHAVVPLAVSAGVGLAILVQWGGEAVREGDGVSAVLAALLVLLVAGQVAATAASTTYAHPADRYLDEAEENENKLVQFGQPADGIQPTLDTVQYAVEQNEGIDVLYYGSDFNLANEAQKDDWGIAGGWYNRLPVPWYTEMWGAEVDSTTELGVVESDPPPVVISRVEHRDEVAQRLDGYVAYEEELTLWGSETVFFVDEEYVRNAGSQSGNDGSENA